MGSPFFTVPTPDDSCGVAVAQLEQALADAPSPRWRERLGACLGRLATDLGGGSAHDASLDQLCRDAPRLTSAVHRLCAERAGLAESAAQLRLRAADADAAGLGVAARRLADEVRRHRGRVARLLHEAYAVDIGGET